MQPFSFFFFVGYSLGGGGGISGRVRALNLTVPLGSGRVGSDNLGYGPGSGFSFEPVQTSNLNAFMFVKIIRDPVSPTEEVSIRFLYESLQITFSNNVLVSKFCG